MTEGLPGLLRSSSMSMARRGSRGMELPVLAHKNDMGKPKSVGLRKLTGRQARALVWRPAPRSPTIAV